MKKYFAIILALTLALALAACGGGAKNADNRKALPEEAEASVQQTSTDGYAEAVPPIYDAALDFSEGLAAVRLDGKWGFIDKTGEIVIPFQYYMVDSFSEGLAVATMDPDGLVGYIDKTGTEVIPYIYKGANPFIEGVAAVQTEDDSGPNIFFIDQTGAEFTPPYYSAEDFSEGLAVVQHGMMNYLYIDKTGKEVISLEGTDRGKPFSEGLALIYHFENKGFIDKSGEMVITLEDYHLPGDVESFSDGLALVKSGIFKNGFIDKSGQLVIEVDGLASSFSEGRAKVSFMDGWGYIDKTGAEVIPGKYDWAHDFSEGLAAVQLDGKLGYINAAGEEVVPFVYDYPDLDEILTFDIDNLDVDQLLLFHDFKVSEGMAMIRLDGKWGFVEILQ